MRGHILFFSCATLLFCACRPSSTERTYTLQGQVLSTDPDQQLATIKHEEIKGFMPAMTMPYKLKNVKPGGLQPGDLINAKLVVASNDAYLTNVNKVGTAPLEKSPADLAATPAPGSELLKPGDPVPNARFVDQDGKTRDFNSFKGSAVVMTFIYTRCPLPNFCPLMDRHFAEIQRAIQGDSSLKKIHLVSVSFDPATDTPRVLKQHARELNADPARWTFLTGQLTDIDPFAARFGVSITRPVNDPSDIAHNLRTAVIDAEGKVVKVYTGPEWSPQQVLADVKSIG